jgi:hypothetical protein
MDSESYPFFYVQFGTKNGYGLFTGSGPVERLGRKGMDDNYARHKSQEIRRIRFYRDKNERRTIDANLLASKRNLLFLKLQEICVCSVNVVSCNICPAVVSYFPQTV